MQALVYVASLAIAAVGQKLNANPKVPTGLVKPVLFLIGAGFYAVMHQPGGWPGSPAFTAWVDDAMLWALALPGAASMIGMTPGMATKNGGTNA